MFRTVPLIGSLTANLQGTSGVSLPTASAGSHIRPEKSYLALFNCLRDGEGAHDLHSSVKQLHLLESLTLCCADTGLTVSPPSPHPTPAALEPDNPKFASTWQPFSYFKTPDKPHLKFALLYFMLLPALIFYLWTTSCCFTACILVSSLKSCVG